MNPKLAKLIVKGTLGLVVSAAIGYTIKMENKLGERIDEHFEPEEN